VIVNSAAVIYFSPTGTTKKILYAIAEGMCIDSPKYIDLTLPNARISNASMINEDIAIIGVPVYEERIPKILYPFLASLKSNNKPVVIVAVYGNIGDGIVLNELKTITENSGFKVIAAGSFIGEHSFSTKEVPIAEGRPTQNDLREARNFGQMIRKRIETIDDLKEISLTIPPEKLPLIAKILPENSARMFTKTPYADMSICNGCGVCVKLCPMSAIHKDTLEIDENQCLRCFCCVKECRRKARKIIYKKKLFVSLVLTAKNKEEKKPKKYI
jgi:ferredoxin/flavodoxin